MEFKPYPYQQYAIKTIIEKPYCGLFLGMGLGKTIITLTAVQRLIDAGKVQHVLVIAPLRVAMDTWTTEAEKWDHLKSLTIQRVLGTAKKREEALNAEADVYVINRENVVWLADNLKANHRSWPFDMVVIDELSSFKSPRAKRFRVLKKLRPRMKRVVGLTGTPAPNGYMDLWPEMYLIDGGERLGKTLTSYRETYFSPGRGSRYVVWEWILREGSAEKIKEKISDICVSMRTDDYLDLPDKRVIDVPVTLPPSGARLYKKMACDSLLDLAGSEISAFQAATVTGKLLQMSGGAVYDDNGNATHIHDAKLEALSEILEASHGDPVLCFVGYKHEEERIKSYFAAYSPRTIQTQQDIQDWNSGKIKLLVSHPASIGHGLNLQQGGHIIVWYSPTWSLELYQQANARLYRQGQKMPTLIYRLIARGTVDEVVVHALNCKDKAQDALISYLKAELASVTKK